MSYIAAIQQHGFARNVNWEVASMDDLSVTLKLVPTEYTKKIWDAPFECHFTTTLKANSLVTEYVVFNTGSKPFDFQAALHSYFELSDISNLKLKGSFQGKTFLNKMLKPPAEEVEHRAEVTIGEEYDRVYMGVNDVTLFDSGKGGSGAGLQIANSGGWRDTVLWNPYGNAGMGYQKFACVESAAIKPVRLEGGSRWSARLELIPKKMPVVLSKETSDTLLNLIVMGKEDFMTSRPPRG